MSKLRSGLGLAGLTVVLGTTTTALANGRFPDAQQLVVDPTDPDHLAVQVTYGFIHTFDHGANWKWICEDAAGYGGVLDPPIAIVESGALIAGVFDGLVVSSPDACDLAFVGGELESRFILDVSTMKTNPAHAVALSSDGLGSEGFDTRVWKSTDSAGTWAQLGTALPSDFLAFTVDAAPDDEDLLYVSGFTVAGSNDYVGSLAVSTDAGLTWFIKPIPGSENDSGPYIAAIDPNDHDRLYVRLSSLAGVLLVSDDAGDTWETIFEAEGALLGFALSPDGSELRIGGDVDGIWAANTTDFAFEQINDMGVRCLTWTPDLLYACAREAIADFTIGQSTDGGITFEPLHHLNCLEGPDASCSATSTIAEVCPAPWGATKQILQTETCESLEGGAPATGGGGTGAGGGGADDEEDDDGCSCTTAPTEERPWSALALAATVAWGITRRRRRRR